MPNLWIDVGHSFMGSAVGGVLSAALGGLFGPLNALIRELGPFKRDLGGFFLEISSGKLFENDRKITSKPSKKPP